MDSLEEVRVDSMTDTLKVTLTLPPVVKGKLIETSNISGMDMDALISSIVANSVGRALSTHEIKEEPDTKATPGLWDVQWKRPSVISHQIDNEWCVDYMQDNPNKWAAVLRPNIPMSITKYLDAHDALYLANADMPGVTVEFGVAGVISSKSPGIQQSTKISDTLWYFPMVGPNGLPDYTIDSKHPTHFMFENVGYAFELDAKKGSILLTSERNASAQPILGVVFIIRIRSSLEFPSAESRKSDVVSISLPLGKPIP